jgi:multidrug efflux pump
LSLVGAFFLMMLFGFTLNLLTLLAIVLAVGLVVDDAIVVVENVERHLQEGMKPFDAAIRGARELFGPIIAMTISLATVYAPIGLQGGLSGSLFREFSFGCGRHFRRRCPDLVTDDGLQAAEARDDRARTRGLDHAPL